MSFILCSRKYNKQKFAHLLTEYVADSKGLIPIPILVVLAISSIIAGGIGYWLGDGLSFKIGVGVGVGLILILPNLQSIIKWFKSIKAEIIEDTGEEGK
jgi:preprotein translocase subunit SecY